LNGNEKFSDKSENGHSATENSLHNYILDTRTDRCCQLCKQNLYWLQMMKLMRLILTVIEKPDKYGLGRSCEFQENRIF
jgi:hypothetical protein